MISSMGITQGNFGSYARRLVLANTIVLTGLMCHDLEYIRTQFRNFERKISTIVGIANGFWQIANFEDFPYLNKVSNLLTGISIGIDLGLSFYNNLNNANLTNAQKAGNITGDMIFIAVSNGTTFGVTYLTSHIPAVGPFVAPHVGFVFNDGFDQFWHGEEFLEFTDCHIIQEESQSIKISKIISLLFTINTSVKVFSYLCF